jgi:2-polyprenyl-6-hydroxyphenyl methylase/3-demethylubiquinone-9 3-methyltransferase
VSIGRAVRTRLGRFEAPVSDAYRSLFIDLDACADLLAGHVEAESILEIGCGDGQMARTLLDRFPTARYEGIDVAPEVGGLFDGDGSRARFRSIDSTSFRAETDERFDLVLLVDVLHHVPLPMRDTVIGDLRSLTAPGGSYAIKDWVRSRSLAHAGVWASDRFLTGDRVAYFDPGELESVIPPRFPADRLLLRARVPPRRNNLLLVYERENAPAAR